MKNNNTSTKWSDSCFGIPNWIKYDFGNINEVIIKNPFYLICPNCKRNMPNKKFRKRKGCKWCVD